ncbi:MAG: bifunctional phosphopantothenoylcysteine decarboxylase/phosphopantothenate--cysteine ligase CoaBC [Candidatus Promineifilaceae bacterium]
MTITVLANRRVVLGVTGSIACYKVVDLASKLTQAGALVDVVMTEAAQRFVSPLSFRSVTGREVYTDMWGLEDHVRHVRLGEAADLLVVAPATAHTIAKLAHGLADNLLTVVALASRCPMLLAPAMDAGMYEHPATRANLDLLAQRGARLVGPAEGRMASGLVGLGRMVEPSELLGHIRLAMGQAGSLLGRRVLVTAGPTREPLDPVRYLSNRSSGRQGLALAQAALDAGAQVTLVAGPIGEPAPIGATHVPVETATEMCEAVLNAAGEADVLLMAAAVADFRPADQSKHKIKKTEVASEGLSVLLARNPDILTEVRALKERQGRPTVILGFAAETEDAVGHGWDKLRRKGLDFLAVNDVTAADAGFEVDTNRIILLAADGRQETLPLQTKSAVAEHLVSQVAAMLAGRDVGST